MWWLQLWTNIMLVWACHPPEKGGHGDQLSSSNNDYLYFHWHKLWCSTGRSKWTLWASLLVELRSKATCNSSYECAYIEMRGTLSVLVEYFTSMFGANLTLGCPHWYLLWNDTNVLLGSPSTLACHTPMNWILIGLPVCSAKEVPDSSVVTRL